MYPYFTPEEAAKYPLTQVTHFMNGSEFISAKTVEKFSRMFRLSPNAMAPGYGLAENVCLRLCQPGLPHSESLIIEAYQKNCAVLVTEEKEGEQVKEIVSVGAPVKDLNLVIANRRQRNLIRICTSEKFLSPATALQMATGAT